MLSDANVRKINSQIDDELRNARWADTHEEKMAALEAVAKLKSLLSEQEAPVCDVDQIANTLIDKLTQPSRPEPHPLATLIEMFISRRR